MKEYPPMFFKVGTVTHQVETPRSGYGSVTIWFDGGWPTLTETNEKRKLTREGERAIG